MTAIEKVDYLLTIIDIILCLIDMALIIYLFFYRFPPEKKKNKFDKFGYYRRHRGNHRINKRLR